MNYFEFYDLPISLHPDQNLIKTKFYALSKQYHPDFYINKSAEEQAEVLELSTLNNKAFQILKDEHKRLNYVLELKNVIVEGENYTLPQDFLMEMMDINEVLMELEFDPNEEQLATVGKQISEQEKALTDKLNTLTHAFDQTASDEQERILGEIKDLYYRQKYLNRLKQQFSKA